MAHHISPSLFRNEPSEDKYELVDRILSASNHYEALGLSQDSSVDEIRRAYIQKSRICHPDKFVPPYPKATESFQTLSIAYKVLSEPKMKASYDTGLGEYTSSYSAKDNAADVFQRLLEQLYTEMMVEGNFQTLRSFLRAASETKHGIQISEEAMDIAEAGFLKMRNFIISSHECYESVQFELLRLHDLHEEIKNVSYFNVWRRVSLSIDIAKTIIQIPLLVNKAIRKRGYSCKSNREEEGLLNLQNEGCLENAICLLESI
jgi:hypothetical protein